MVYLCLRGHRLINRKHLGFAQQSSMHTYQNDVTTLRLNVTWQLATITGTRMHTDKQYASHADVAANMDDLMHFPTG